MEEQKEIQSQIRKQQEKYTYYIIALCVTAIGFSVHITLGLPLKLSQIPLGLAVLSWGISVYSGLKFINYTIGVLLRNNEYFEVLQGKHPDSGTDAKSIALMSASMMGGMRIMIRKASKFENWQKSLFGVGMLLFLVWHIWEMYLKA